MKTSWKNFSERELRCSHCGKTNPNQEFQELMEVVQEMRDDLGFPMGVSSGYRCEDHPIEAAKDEAGHHSHAAIDLRVSYDRAYDVVSYAVARGLFGVGVSQKGDARTRFIHLDNRPESQRRIWSY